MSGSPENGSRPPSTAVRSKPLEEWESEGGRVLPPEEEPRPLASKQAALHARDGIGARTPEPERSAGTAVKDIQTRLREHSARNATTLLEAVRRRGADSSTSTPRARDGSQADYPTTHILRSCELEPSAEARLNDVFAQRYRLKEVLGSGGMGVVYLARDLELELDVALKLLRRDVTNIPSAVAPFRKEVRLARLVTHRNVSRTFDIAFHGADLFITMEPVAGRTLNAWTSDAPLTPEEVAELGLQLCSGLAAAHRAGVVHRDLKPQNVMVEREESGSIRRVVIMDFGVAQTLDLELDEVTSPGQVVGTPSYMSPEQSAGLRVDPRADLFSFGVILFELLTGRLPWERPDPTSGSSARLKLNAPDLGEARRLVPDEIAALTMACLALAPEQRPASAELVRTILTPWADSFERRGRPSIAFS
ncbi:MAG: serine/threonine-protein kinase [Polyangiaceae bacterium]